MWHARHSISLGATRLSVTSHYNQLPFASAVDLWLQPCLHSLSAATGLSDLAPFITTNQQTRKGFTILHNTKNHFILSKIVNFICKENVRGADAYINVYPRKSLKRTTALKFKRWKLLYCYICSLSRSSGKTSFNHIWSAAFAQLLRKN